MDGKISQEEFRKRKGMEELVTLVGGKFKWKDGGKLGYNIAWVSLMTSSLPYLEVARDCIQRACGSSWWKWLAGAIPFFSVGPRTVW